MKNTLPAVADVAEWQRRFDYLHTVVGSWVRHVPTLEDVQATHKALLDLEMVCEDFDLSQDINALFKAIDRVQDVVQHPDFDPKDVGKYAGYLNIPAGDLNFNKGLEAKATTLVFAYAIWTGRKGYIGRAEKIGAEIRRRDRAAQKAHKQKASA